jgi:hypothetical protein
MFISDTYGGTGITASSHPELDYTFDSASTDQIINPVNPHIKGSHIFYIYAVAEGGKEVW